MCSSDLGGVVPEGQLCFQEILVGRRVKLFQARRFGLGELFERELGQRRSPPQRKSLGELLLRRCRMRLAEELVAPSREYLECTGIERVRRDLKDITRRLGYQNFGL